MVGCVEKEPKSTFSRFSNFITGRKIVFLITEIKNIFLYSNTDYVRWFLQMWLMERLELISPPDNIDKYTPNCFVRRKKRFSLKMGRHEWGKVFAYCDFSIKWVIPWWKLEKMIGCNTQPFCRLPSLSKLTFYYPCRVKRQYGIAQTIPTGDLRRPYEFPVSQEVE